MFIREQEQNTRMREQTLVPVKFNQGLEISVAILKLMANKCLLFYYIEYVKKVKERKDDLVDIEIITDYFQNLNNRYPIFKNLKNLKISKKWK